jgi:hypothetical protein
MSSKGFLTLFFVSFFCLCIFESCKSPKPPETAIVNTPEELEVKASDIIRSSIKYAIDKEGKIDDSIQLGNIKLLQLIYENNQFASLWSIKEQWKPTGDSLRNFIGEAKLYGLFPEDYYYPLLDAINRDSSRIHSRKLPGEMRYYGQKPISC